MNSKWGNYDLWVSLTAAVLLGVQTVGVIFGLQLAPEKYKEVTAAVNALLGVLVVLGIISNPEAGKGYKDRE
ncbi:Bacteriophage holin [compost metagenome]